MQARFAAEADAAAHVFVDVLGDRCEVGGSDGHHLERVRRLAPGERVTAADGRGAWRRYVVRAAAPGRLVLDAEGDPCVEPVAPIGVAAAIAPAKGRVDDVVAALTELGVVEIALVATARGVVRWDRARAADRIERLRAVARAAAMQSRRATLPLIAGPVGITELAARPGLVVADRGGAAVDELALPDTGPWTVLTGPEGGWAPAELAALAGAPRLRVGPHVLRAATAPIAAVAVLYAHARLHAP